MFQLILHLLQFLLNIVFPSLQLGLVVYLCAELLLELRVFALLQTHLEVDNLLLGLQSVVISLLSFDLIFFFLQD